ncbi:MAG: M3 family metallopeptidase [Pseudomonadales bacterium]
MSNPLLTEWQTPYGLPPFSEIKTEHYKPAFIAGMKQQNDEVDAIVANTDSPTFANTIEALEASGSLLSKVSPLFYAMLSSLSTEELRAAQSELVPMHSEHTSKLFGRGDLFRRVEAVYQADQSQLTPEQQQLLSETRKRMVRQGAGLAPEQAARVVEIDTRISSLQTQFAQNVLADSNDFKLVLDEAETAGLPESVKRTGAAEAAARNLNGKYVFTISRSSFTPFMQYAENRDLREKMWRAYTHCGNNDNAYNNHAVAEEIATLRGERARLMGYGSHNEFVLDDRMAGTPANVTNLLDNIWQPAKERAKQEVDTLQAAVQAEGGNFQLAPWDWWHYAEKVRKQQFDLDNEELKQYFELNRVRDGAFNVATQLYGITFEEVDVELYHPDTQAFEVREADGTLIGLFITDYHLRPSKKSGAWMNAFRSQKRFGGKAEPIILNTCNFPQGSPCLLTLEEVRTLFHEFGHGLHGLLSNVEYQSLAGTAVKRDFVELPSQIMEHWAIEPEVLRSYAKHFATGAVIPDSSIEKIRASQAFNSGFATTEYLAASYLDLSWHEPVTTKLDAEALEEKAMNNIGLIKEIAPRYRSSYFQHIFSGGYSAGYYAYIWAEVLDADAFEEFKAKGLFDQATAQAFRENILERGGTDDPMVLYKQFKGAEPAVEPLMRNRGLV